MAFNFWAFSQNDGIVFSYNNCQNAIYVYRENGEVKEREVQEEEILNETKLIQYMNIMIPRLTRGGILLILDYILVTVFKIKMTTIWSWYIINLILYVAYIVYKNLEDSIKISKNLKQYHSAEHMIYNANTEVLTVQELRNFSKYANECGKNDDSVKIFNVMLTVVTTNIFCGVVLLKYDICYYIIIYIFYIIILNILYYLVEEARKKGLFNHIFQPLFLEEPTDEQLELAIYGIKRVQELEKEKSN